MFEKLKKEWKTFVWSLVTLAWSIHDSIAFSGVDVTPVYQFFPERIQPLLPVVIPLGFLLLRRWQPITTVTVTENN